MGVNTLTVDVYVREHDVISITRLYLCVCVIQSDVLFMLGLGFLSAYCTGPFPFSG